MTNIFITIDTELAVGLHRRGRSLDHNYELSIEADCAHGTFGATYQARRLAAAGLKATFFLDPMPSLIYGTEFLKPLVDTLLEAGHEVQLHLHPEWLEMLDRPPVAYRGPQLSAYSEEEQTTLIACAVQQLEQCGAPTPIAFRAGNFGADHRTVNALARLGIPYSSNVNCGYEDGRTSRPELWPVAKGTVVEVPVTCIADRPGHLRPLQLCAVSSWEMRAAIDHAIAFRGRACVIVLHSFELIDRRTRTPVRAMLRRFDAMIAMLDRRRSEAPCIGFGDVVPQSLLGTEALPPLAFNPVRTAIRLGEVVVGREATRLRHFKWKLAQNA